MSVSDRNNCKEVKYEFFEDCKGEEFCIRKEIETPFFQPFELIAPLDIPTSWGSEKHYYADLQRDMYKNKKGVFIHINRPLKVGDIIELKCGGQKYYLKKKLKRRDKFNNFVFLVERLDGFRMNYIDLKAFKKGTRIFTKGYLKEKP